MCEALQKIENFKRDKLKTLLLQCTEDQQIFFNRMYKSIDLIPKEKIPWAIQQCENTIKWNEEKTI